MAGGEGNYLLLFNDDGMKARKRHFLILVETQIVIVQKDCKIK